MEVKILKNLRWKFSEYREMRALNVELSHNDNKSRGLLSSRELFPVMTVVRPALLAAAAQGHVM